MTDIDRFKRERAGHRGAVTKYLVDLNNLLQTSAPDNALLDAKLELLSKTVNIEFVR